MTAVPDVGASGLAGRRCRCARTCAAAAPYGAPQLDVAVRLNTNENPYPPPPELVAELTADGRATRPGDLHRYPDRDAVGAAHRPGRLPAPRRPASRSTRANVWAANGSQRGPAAAPAGVRRAGPDRARASSRPTRCTRSSPRAPRTEWLPAPRRAGLLRSTSGSRGRRCCASTRPTSRSSPARTTRPAQSLDRRRPRPCWSTPRRGIVVVDEAYAEFSDRPERGPAARHGTAEKLVVCRTMSKAFAFAGGPARLPRRRTCRGRGAAAGAAALPPLGPHPGRARGPRCGTPTPRSARWRCCAPSATGWSPS